MLALAIDTSAKPCSVAILSGEKRLSEYFQNSGNTHSETLMPLIGDILRNNSLKLSDLDYIAVSNGPGSFTGIRIGISAVKGLCLGADIPVVPVSTLEAMAYNISSIAGERIICACMDARRGEVYNALFREKSFETLRLCEDRAIALSDLSAALKGEKIMLVGDGSTLAFEFLSEKGIDCAILPENLRYQSAYGVGLAALSKKPVSGSELLPVYLRLSQAERERQSRSK
ncbi:tRNA (adenosine(37)-N6)-threonylcarbamoyltransferase complex dimerization subunit type 1 TsaB [Clostridiaceae bacterium OttesenSCG-928-D20]|nr:tRNA (adenosine(37)-N6)-threonylcarbamoyltransferase complex dimerization subunit type 1 TsaB [Clostridiaceae bacterium OttesenSCG-928-D20]